MHPAGCDQSLDHQEAVFTAALDRQALHPTAALVCMTIEIRLFEMFCEPHTPFSMISTCQTVIHRIHAALLDRQEIVSYVFFYVSGRSFQADPPVA